MLPGEGKEMECGDERENVGARMGAGGEGAKSGNRQMECLRRKDNNAGANTICRGRLFPLPVQARPSFLSEMGRAGGRLE